MTEPTNVFTIFNRCSDPIDPTIVNIIQRNINAKRLREALRAQPAKVPASEKPNHPFAEVVELAKELRSQVDNGRPIEPAMRELAEAAVRNFENQIVKRMAKAIVRDAVEEGLRISGFSVGVTFMDASRRAR